MNTMKFLIIMIATMFVACKTDSTDVNTVTTTEVVESDVTEVETGAAEGAVVPEVPAPVQPDAEVLEQTDTGSGEADQ
jgi:hypothetical protein